MRHPTTTICHEEETGVDDIDELNIHDGIRSTDIKILNRFFNSVTTLEMDPRFFVQ